MNKGWRVNRLLFNFHLTAEFLEALYLCRERLPPQWRYFSQLSVAEFAAELLKMAGAVKLRAFLKRKQSVKKKKTKPPYDKHQPHVAMAKILKV